MSATCGRCSYPVNSDSATCLKCGGPVEPIPSNKNAAPRSSDEASRKHAAKETSSISDGWKLFATFGGIFVLVIVLANMQGERPPMSTSTATNASQPRAQHEVGDRSAPSPSPSPRLFHVTAQALNVRQAPSMEAGVLGQLPKWQNVAVLGIEKGWATIELKNGVGFVASQYLGSGDGKTAEAMYCDSVAGPNPFNGEVLSRNLSRGSHHLIVSGGQEPAAVRLKDSSENVLLTMFVAPYNVAKVTDIPDGAYRVYFATGDEWSRGCDRFVLTYGVFRDNEIVNLQTTNDGYYEYSSQISYDLRQQAGGNFNPQSLTADDF